MFSIIKDSAELLKLVNIYKSKKFIFLVFLGFFNFIFELGSIGSVIPFISMLINPQEFYEIQYVYEISKKVGIQSPSELLKIITVIFIFFIIFAGISKLAFLYLSNKVAYDFSSEVASKIYSNVLRQNYSYHLANSLNDLTSMITQKARESNQIIISLVNIINSIVIIFPILGIFTFFYPKVSFFSVGFFIILYLVFGLFSKKKILSNSEIIFKNQNKIVKFLNDSVNSIRDLILSDKIDIYIQSFKSTIFKSGNKVASNSLLTLSPRYFVETFSMLILTLFLSFYFFSKGNIISIIPIISAIVLGAQRLLPIINNLYVGWSVIASQHPNCREMKKLITLESKKLINEDKFLNFNKSINIKSLSFSYEAKKNDNVLDEVNIEIKKNSVVAILGKTGTGKSTFLDILMFFLTPTKGEIFVDNTKLDFLNRKSWQRKISYVPQNIFLIDDTIKKNITLEFNEKNINYDRLQKAVEVAQLEKFVANLELKLDTYIGENGVRLSGGQKQRIAIARALYRNSEILIFDEATSALDDETTAELISSIIDFKSTVTIIFVTHRLSSIEKKCDTIYKLENKTLVKVER